MDIVEINRLAPKVEKGPVYVGIDNGTSGSIGAIVYWRALGGSLRRHVSFQETPVSVSQDYTKKEKKTARVDVVALRTILQEIILGVPQDNIHVVLERPMIAPMRFVASINAARAFEATLIVLEGLALPVVVVDSRSWQKEILPTGIKGHADLKVASHDAGVRLFPGHSREIDSHGDADGLLIAEFLRKGDQGVRQCR